MPTFILFLGKNITFEYVIKFEVKKVKNLYFTYLGKSKM
jgi:hypothetical protein